MKYTGRTQSHVKLDNQRMILNVLFEKGPLSRADLAKVLASSKPTVSKNVEGLLEEKMIYEIGKADNSVGKKAMLLDVNGDYGHVFAVDLSKNKLRMVITNLKGEWLHYESHMLYEQFDVIGTIKAFLSDKENEKSLVRQIVIAYPGVVGHNNEYYLTNVKMKEQWLSDIMKYVRSEFELEAVVKNDVNLATIAEKQYGPLSETANLYYISGDTGIGSGVILNHKLYEGDRNAAGEIGFILPSQKGEDSYHTLEERICINALTTRYSEKSGTVVDIDGFKVKIHEGDPIALKLYDEVLINMSMAITNVSSILDIRNVVVYGRLFELADDTVERIQQMITEMTPLETKLSMSNVDHATLKGAVHTGVKEMIRNMI